MAVNDPILWNEFSRGIFEILMLSDDIGDGWVKHGDLDTCGTAYLTKKVVKEHDTKNKHVVMVFEYHVVYDLMYGVPKLCFRAAREDGYPLKFEDCKRHFKISAQENPLQLITQMDHPVLQTPIYTLHPCKTADLIKESFDNSRNPVVSWLSTVAPTLGLYIDNEYSTLT